MCRPAATHRCGSASRRSFARGRPGAGSGNRAADAATASGAAVDPGGAPLRGDGGAVFGLVGGLGTAELGGLRGAADRGRPLSPGLCGVCDHRVGLSAGPDQCHRRHGPPPRLLGRCSGPPPLAGGAAGSDLAQSGRPAGAAGRVRPAGK